MITNQFPWIPREHTDCGEVIQTLESKIENFRAYLIGELNELECELDRATNQDIVSEHFSLHTSEGDIQTRRENQIRLGTLGRVYAAFDKKMRGI